VWTDAPALIAYREGEMFLLLHLIAHLDHHLGVLIAELDGVGQKVAQDVLQTKLISYNTIRSFKIVIRGSKF